MADNEKFPFMYLALYWLSNPIAAEHIVELKVPYSSMKYSGVEVSSSNGNSRQKYDAAIDIWHIYSLNLQLDTSAVLIPQQEKESSCDQPVVPFPHAQANPWWWDEVWIQMAYGLTHSFAMLRLGQIGVLHCLRSLDRTFW